MNNKTMATYCSKYIDSSVCEMICAIDGVESSDTNVFQLNLMLNTWVALGIDIGFPGWEPTLLGLLHTKGLTGTVQACDRAFHAIVSGKTDHGGELFSDACNFLQGVPSTADKSVEKFRLLSQLFRFAKRFTYDTDTAAQACFEKFLEANRNCYSSSDYRCRPIFKYIGPGEKVTYSWTKSFSIAEVKTKGAPKPSDDQWYHTAYPIALEMMRCGAADSDHVEVVRTDTHQVWAKDKVIRNEPSYSEGGPEKPRPGYTLITKVKELVTEMIGEKPILPLSAFDGILSNGAAVAYTRRKDKVVCSSVKTRSDKLDALYSFDPRFGHKDEGYFIIKAATTCPGFREKILEAEREGSNMIAVPKSMKERRLIKPEPVHRSYYAGKVRKLLETQLIYTGGYYYLRWDDQSINQGLAQLGAAGLGYSSIDATAASDSQSREITFMVVPEWFRPLLYNAISDYVIVDGKRVRVKCLSTSGNQITWFMLGVVMWAIAEYGCRWYTDQDGNVLHAHAYGDDLIVPDVAYETVVELLEIFGFVINRDKSFTGSQVFRESCGGDYVVGYNVTPSYWRRGIVDIRDYPDTIAFVCNLQHKLYEFPTVRNYLRYIAYKLDPKVTASPVGAECDDLWDGNVTPEESELLPHRKLKVTDVKDVKYSQTLQDHQYYMFLKHGRSFASDVDRRLGISIPYLSPNLVAEPTLRWVLAAPPYYHNKTDK